MTIHLRHPYTNQLPIGYLRDGAPIWPVMGGDGTADPTDPKPAADPPAGDPPKPDGPPAEDKPLGASGEAALKAEREARKAAEKELARYRKAEADKAEADKSEAEKRAAAEQRAADAELRALRLEVAHEKGLTPSQAKRLVGATRDELAADADEILVDFAAKVPAKPAVPKPDPSQGARGEPAQPRPSSLTEALRRLPEFGQGVKG
jgi:hypothetical protein